MTKAQMRGLVRQWIDDPNGKRWNDANLDLLIELTHNDLWGELLGAVPWAVSQLDNFTSLRPPGYIDLHMLPDGDLTKRFFRVQMVTRDNRRYSAADPRDIVIQDNKEIVAPDFTFVVLGDQLWLFPLNTTQEVELRYSFLPLPFSSLPDDAHVEWPESYESALIFEAAGRALSKGDAENGSVFFAKSLQSMQQLKSHMKRQHPGPDMIYLADDPWQWGGT